MNPESNFNPGQNSLLHKNRSPLCVVLSASAPLWRSYAALQTYMYHQRWLISSINQYISQPCTFLLVSKPLFRSPVSSNQKYVNCYSEVLFLFTGTNHHPMYFHQPQRHRGACMPLHTKNVHHRLPAGEKRQASNNELSKLQEARHQYLLCVRSQQSR